MPQAKIKVNGVDGSNDNVPIGTVVNLDNHGTGGELTYLWDIVSQPPGPGDALSNPAIQTPTFTPRKEGTYLVNLVVNLGLPTEVTNQIIVAVRHLKSFLRVPAPIEQLEANSVTGWAEGAAANPLLRMVDSILGAPVKAAAVADGPLSVGDVVRLYGYGLIKAGLPGAESLPKAGLADSGDALAEHMRLGLVLGASAGGAIGNGTVIQVLLVGAYQTVITTLAPAATNPVVGDPVFLALGGNMALTPNGAGARRIGHITSAVFLLGTWNITIFFDAPPSPLRNLLLGQDTVPADNATFYTFQPPFPMHFKAGMLGCSGFVVTPPGAPVTINIKRLLATLATINVDVAGVVTFTAAADFQMSLNNVNIALKINGLASGIAGIKILLVES